MSLLESYEEYEVIRKGWHFDGSAEEIVHVHARLMNTCEELRAIARDAQRALEEMERLNRDSFGVELKSAYMILREAVKNFDRKRLGKPLLPEWLTQSPIDHKFDRS